MIKVKNEGIVLGKTQTVFEEDGVLNPAVIQDGNIVHMFYRAVRKGNYSSIGYCKLNGPLTVEHRNDSPLIYPQHDYESYGVEDPRITKIDGLYYLTYTGYDGLNALGALATSTDLVHFEKKGVITPVINFARFKYLAESKELLNEKYVRFNEREHVDKIDGKPLFLWDKDLAFFPRRINGKLTFLHRIRPDIQIAAVNELSDLTGTYWEDYFIHLESNIALTPKFEHEASYIGGGCPPIETEIGWLIIYHGVQDTPKGYVYSACVALLDLENPCKEIARLPYALFSPEFEWELIGYVNNVCFPTGTSLFGDTLYIYYGAADEQIACASIKLNDLLQELIIYKTN